jgi:hypothetical protein
MVIFSACLSAVFAGLCARTHASSSPGAAHVWAMVAAAIVLGWLMLPFPI